MKLGTKLLLAFLLVGVIPFALVGLISVKKSSNALSDLAYGQLEGMRGVKKIQVENFFLERQDDAGVLMETVGTLRKEAFGKLEAIQMAKKAQIENYFKTTFLQMGVFAKSRDVYRLYEELIRYQRNTGATETSSYDTATINYQGIYEQFGLRLSDFQQESGYYDVFILCAKYGHVMYSAVRKSDIGTNLVYGKYKESGLAKIWKKVITSGEAGMVDFEPYAPSNNEPAAFAGYPIRDEMYGSIVGVVVFQMPLDQINSIVQQRYGLGKTGETYLVGSDNLMRSDSFLDPVNHSVKASFANPDKGRVDTESVRDALLGKNGARVIIGYNGNPVLSCYDPLKVMDITWAIICEIDVAEAFSPVDKDGNEFYKKYIKMYGYYDLFLINPDGYVFYTVTKESDYQTNMLNGKYSSSNFGKLVQKVIKTRQFGIADFAPYAPSNNEPFGFIAQPVVYDDKVELVIALQLSLDTIDSIMQIRAGMGKTGETYLVGQDKLMRSDSFLDPVNHTVKASFANPAKGSVDTEAAREALSGKTGQKIITHYNGSQVLSAYTPIKVGDTTWAMIAEIDKSEAFAAAYALYWFIGITAIIVLAAIITVAVLITRSITNPIARIIEGLNEGAEQVSSAAGQVSSSSQSLSEGSSEQAASIEETSSSLEEISSMTKQNADNAGQANSLMKDTNQVVAFANQSMQKLIIAMQDLSTASDETQKVVKTIDEIAFQTNLLALNAAVEAARAGEAGAGFAVVAEEVRNLALRSAEAAKNTAVLIEGTVKKVGDGSELVNKTNDEFTKVAESGSRVGELVGEISAASNEQAQGIGQVNTAVTEMDKVTQQNAANAEETASAAEEMSAQAEQMKEYVNELVLLVGGSSDKHHHTTVAVRPQKKYTGLPVPQSKAVALPSSGVEVKPNQVIPMDDDDFDNF